MQIRNKDIIDESFRCVIKRYTYFISSQCLVNVESGDSDVTQVMLLSLTRVTVMSCIELVMLIKRPNALVYNDIDLVV